MDKKDRLIYNCTPMKKLMILSLFLIRAVPAFAGSSDELHVEGISYEAQNEAASIAVVNGEFLKEGDEYQHYKVVKITDNFVRVSDNQTGAETDLSITGSAPKVEAPKPQTPVPALPVQPASAPAAAPKPSNPLAMFNPAGMINMANEVAVFAGMKQVFMAAQAYFQMREPAEGITMEDLIKADMISDIYGGEYKGYRFSIKSKYDDIQVSADPVADGPERNHFLMDKHGVLRVEKGKPATVQSSPRNV